MAPRYIALLVGALIVFGASVYLFREVRARPAPVSAPSGATTPEKRAEAPAPPAAETKPVAAPPKPPMMGAGRAPTPPPDAPEADEPPAKHATNPRIADLVRPEDGADKQKANPKLEAAMAEANKAYDRFDYDEAKQLAQRVLSRAPGNTRMLRILVSASCLSNDPQTAQTNYLLLPANGPDRQAMKTRCQRDANIELKDQ